MWAILHIPSGSFLVRVKDGHEIYKTQSKEEIEKIFNYYFSGGDWRSYQLTRFIEGNTAYYSPLISEFDIVWVH
jgi:hypothetical protein